MLRISDLQMQAFEAADMRDFEDRAMAFAREEGVVTAEDTDETMRTLIAHLVAQSEPFSIESEEHIVLLFVLCLAERRYVYDDPLTRDWLANTAMTPEERVALLFDARMT